MRIDPTRIQPGTTQAVGRMQQVDLGAAGAYGNDGVAGSFKSDQVTFSQQAMDMQVARKALAETPAVRQEKVEALKAQVQSGTYTVDSQEVARKLISGI